MIVVNTDPIPVSGSVTVANAASAPIPVKDVDRAACEPFQIGGFAEPFSSSGASKDLVTVPAGKRLLIEHASPSFNLGGPGGLLYVNLVSGSQQEQTFVINTLTCTVIGQSALNFAHACLGPTKHLVAQGETLKFGFATLTSVTSGSYAIFVSGYYESVP